MLNRLGLAVLITATTLAVEVWGGLQSNSLALLSDAGHVLSDLLALGLSWYGVRQTMRPANYRMTYGYHRVSIFVAFLNAATLIGIGLLVLAEAYRRLSDPHPVHGGLMLGVAVAGLALNLSVIFLLKAHLGDLAVRSAFLHVLGDVLGSLAAIAGGGVILFTQWQWVDSAAGVIIAAIIIYGSLRILQESVHVLLDATPGGLDITAVLQDMHAVPGVLGVHHLHIWGITPDIRALSCHISVEDTSVSEAAGVLARLNAMLDDRFRIGHSTIQLEYVDCDANELYCNLGPDEGNIVVRRPHSHGSTHREESGQHTLRPGAPNQ